MAIKTAKKVKDMGQGRCKTKTKVITMTNHNSRKQSNEPIRAGSKYMSPGHAKRGKMRASKS